VDLAFFAISALMQSFLAFLAENAKNAFELFIVDQYKTQPTTREMLS